MTETLKAGILTFSWHVVVVSVVRLMSDGSLVGSGGLGELQKVKTL
jgi:hypothetical protein